MAKKHYPCVRNIRISDASPYPGAHAVIDVAQYLSKLNRRLYRQGRYYSVKVDIDPAETAQVEVYALRDDWGVQQAFQEAYKVYLENNAEEREALGGRTARWEDFRVDHGYTTGWVPKPALFDETGATIELAAGEFELSTVTDTAQVSRHFTWDPHAAAGQYSMLAEYALKSNSQATPSDPETDGPYANIRNELDQGQMVDLQEHGNAPPYDSTGVNTASPWVKVAVLQGGAATVQKLSTGYFTAPCGLVVIRNVGTGGSDVNITRIAATVKTGDYKGVHAPSMLE
jgi:hypothetical protein